MMFDLVMVVIHMVDMQLHGKSKVASEKEDGKLRILQKVDFSSGST